MIVRIYFMDSDTKVLKPVLGERNYGLGYRGIDLAEQRCAKLREKGTDAFLVDVTPHFPPSSE